MSIVQLSLPGARVLDLFAGSGALGIEALSRGAASAEFVDADSRSLAVVRVEPGLARRRGSIDRHPGGCSGICGISEPRIPTMWCSPTLPTQRTHA